LRRPDQGTGAGNDQTYQDRGDLGPVPQDENPFPFEFSLLKEVQGTSHPTISFRLPKVLESKAEGSRQLLPSAGSRRRDGSHERLLRVARDSGPLYCQTKSRPPFAKRDRLATRECRVRRINGSCCNPDFWHRPPGRKECHTLRDRAAGRRCTVAGSVPHNLHICKAL